MKNEKNKEAWESECSSPDNHNWFGYLRCIHCKREMGSIEIAQKLKENENYDPERDA